MKYFIILLPIVLMASCNNQTSDCEALIISETETTIDSIYFDKCTGEVIDHVITNKQEH